MLMGKNLNGGVAHWLAMLQKLAPYRKDFDQLCAGAWIMDASAFDAQLACAKYILDGHEGEPAEAGHFPSTERFDEAGAADLETPPAAPRRWTEEHERRD